MRLRVGACGLASDDANDTINSTYLLSHDDLLGDLPIIGVLRNSLMTRIKPSLDGRRECALGCLVQLAACPWSAREGCARSLCSVHVPPDRAVAPSSSCEQPGWRIKLARPNLASLQRRVAYGPTADLKLTTMNVVVFSL